MCISSSGWFWFPGHADQDTARTQIRLEVPGKAEWRHCQNVGRAYDWVAVLHNIVLTNCPLDYGCRVSLRRSVNRAMLFEGT